MIFREKLKVLVETNWIKTIYINFHYFPLRKAAHLPILVAYRTVFRKVNGRVFLECPTSTGILKFGYKILGTQDYSYERSVWQVNGTLILRGKRISIGRGTKFCVLGTCVLGEDFSVTGNTSIICCHHMEFGNNVLISWDVLIMDSDYHRIINENDMIINDDKPIYVGNDVWIGCQVTVLKGSKIPSNTIIAARSVVTSELNKEGCIYTSGNKIIKERVRWEK